jgi:uncharacterized membrane protein YecN with MAPEG domain
MKLTPVYAALLALMFVYLSVRTIRLRLKLGVTLGEGGNAELHRAARVQGNFAEYVPFALLLVFFLEMETSSNAMIHLLCGALVLGRVVHACSVSRVHEDLRFRVVGMVLTFAAIVSAALALIARAIGLM